MTDEAETTLPVVIEPPIGATVPINATFGDPATVTKEEAMEVLALLKDARKAAMLFGISIGDLKQIVGKVTNADLIEFADDPEGVRRLQAALLAMAENAAHQFHSMTKEDLADKNLTQGLERKIRCLIQLNAEFVRGATMNIDMSTKTLNIVPDHLVKSALKGPDNS